MTATEVSRGFSAALDRVQRGERIEIIRGGEAVARLVPAIVPNGAAVIAAFESAVPVPDAPSFKEILAMLPEEDYSWLEDFS